jgi:hypothetical protein
MKNIIIFASLLGILWSCSNDDAQTNTQEFEAGEVFVGIKSGTDLNELFEFINLFDHQVDHVSSLVFTSNLASDQLQFVLDTLNDKSYTNDGEVWFVTGYLQHQTNEITIFPRLFGMENSEYQDDWLNAMNELELSQKHHSESSSGIIQFYVPEGQEMQWKNHFSNYDIVDWAQLNYFGDYEPLPN